MSASGSIISGSKRSPRFDQTLSSIDSQSPSAKKKRSNEQESVQSPSFLMSRESIGVMGSIEEHPKDQTIKSKEAKSPATADKESSAKKDTSLNMITALMAAGNNNISI